MNNINVLVIGTPGVGKTTFSKKLTSKLNLFIKGL